MKPPAGHSSVVSSMWSPQFAASEYLSRALRQASISLTLGVFLGAALTTGAAFGLAAAYIANDRVIHKLRKATVAVIKTARDTALNTREGQALANAVLQHAPLPSDSSSSSSSDVSTNVQLNALRADEKLLHVELPVSHNKPFSVCGSTVHLSGYTSQRADGTPIKGIVVSEDTANELKRRLSQSRHQLLREAGCLITDEGAEAARTCALGHLAILEHLCGGLSNVRQVHKVTCFVNSAPNTEIMQMMVDKCLPPFMDAPKVADGYSDLFVALLGPERGSHARSAVCVSGLSGGAAVEVEAVVELVDASRAPQWR